MIFSEFDSLYFNCLKTAMTASSSETSPDASSDRIHENLPESATDMFDICNGNNLGDKGGKNQFKQILQKFVSDL